MNADALARNTITRLKVIRQKHDNTDVLLDYLRVCRRYESDYTYFFSDEALQHIENSITFFERQGKSNMAHYYECERQFEQRRRATWHAVCSILDAQTTEEMIAADNLLAAANEMPVSEYISDNGILKLIPSDNALIDLLAINFGSSHPINTTPEFERYMLVFHNWPPNNTLLVKE